MRLKNQGKQQLIKKTRKFGNATTPWVHYSQSVNINSWWFCSNDFFAKVRMYGQARNVNFFHFGICYSHIFLLLKMGLYPTQITTFMIFIEYKVFRIESPSISRTSFSMIGFVGSHIHSIYVKIDITLYIWRYPHYVNDHKI